ncbi:hypothetical protein HR12_23475 [Microbacterium sp. SUBG005]|nr:hypothetical protein HR12_23475 [Microbacterium sp. SUBG005]
MTRIDDPNEYPISKIVQRLDALEKGNPLESASVTRGRLRFIGGLLLIDSGGTLQVIGSFDGTGNFEWSGPWKFDSGNGEIAGNVNLTGDFNLTGQMNVTGGIEILGPGKIKVGNVIIENGKITAGSGAAQVTIDGASGKITAGNMSMDPTVSGGALTFANGAQVFTDGGDRAALQGKQRRPGYRRLRTSAERRQRGRDQRQRHPHVARCYPVGPWNRSTRPRSPDPGARRLRTKVGRNLRADGLLGYGSDARAIAEVTKTVFLLTLDDGHER